MAWHGAGAYASSLVRTLGPGWRLPTIEELQLLYQQKEAVGGFDRGYFHWSSTELDNDRALSLVDKTGGAYPLRKRGDACFVRLIREFGPNDTINVEKKEIVVRVEPDEEITWSRHWQYNYEKNFSQYEKQQILQSVRTTGLTPDAKIVGGFHVESSSFSVFVYFVDGFWEINGARRK